MTVTARNSSGHVGHKVGRVVVPRERIADRVGELGEQITADYRGRDVTILAVMNGAAVFLADLIRRLSLPVKLETTTARSYRGRSLTPAPLRGRVSTGRSAHGRLPGRRAPSAGRFPREIPARKG